MDIREYTCQMSCGKPVPRVRVIRGYRSSQLWVQVFELQVPAVGTRIFSISCSFLSYLIPSRTPNLMDEAELAKYLRRASVPVLTGTLSNLFASMALSLQPIPPCKGTCRLEATEGNPKLISGVSTIHKGSPEGNLKRIRWGSLRRAVG